MLHSFQAHEKIGLKVYIGLIILCMLGLFSVKLNLCGVFSLLAMYHGKQG
jgi:hypothetical protein